MCPISLFVLMPIVIDEVKFTILPLPSVHSSCPSKENLNSVVVRLDYGEFSMLFTGDAEESELDWLVDNYATLLDVDVLKASHHGSDNGLTDEFIDAVTPNKVVISAGVNARYGHPMAGAVDAYESAVGSSKVYCTNRHGTVRVFGYASGSSRVYKQRVNKKDCTYDGVHY